MQTLDYALMPPNMQELVRLVGFASAVALVEQFGGLTLRIPLGETQRGRAMLDDLARYAGEEAAQRLAQAFWGTSFYIPNCKLALIRARDAQMIGERNDMAEMGFSEREIVAMLARKYRLTDRYVWRLLKKPIPEVARPPTDQVLLPECENRK